MEFLKPLLCCFVQYNALLYSTVWLIKTFHSICNFQIITLKFANGVKQTIMSQNSE